MQWKVEGNQIDKDYLLKNVTELKPDIFGLTLLDHDFDAKELEMLFKDVGYALHEEANDGSSEFK